MEQTNEIVKFEVGKVYATRSICDYDCIFTHKIVRRTAKFVVSLGYNGEEKRYKVFIYDGAECFREGRYSMAPTFKATNTLAKVHEQDLEAEPKQVEEPKAEPTQEAKQEETKVEEPKQEEAENLAELCEPQLVRESQCYLYYTYLGRSFRVAKHNRQFGLFTKFMEINREFEEEVNGILNGKR